MITINRLKIEDMYNIESLSEIANKIEDIDMLYPEYNILKEVIICYLNKAIGVTIANKSIDKVGLDNLTELNENNINLIKNKDTIIKELYLEYLEYINIYIGFVNMCCSSYPELSINDRMLLDDISSTSSVDIIKHYTDVVWAYKNDLNDETEDEKTLIATLEELVTLAYSALDTDTSPSTKRVVIQQLYETIEIITLNLESEEILLLLGLLILQSRSRIIDNRN